MVLTFHAFCISDIDECREIHGLCLNGRCHNTMGSFTCTCPSGFVLSVDGRECAGKKNLRSLSLSLLSFIIITFVLFLNVFRWKLSCYFCRYKEGNMLWSVPQKQMRATTTRSHDSQGMLLQQRCSLGRKHLRSMPCSGRK